MESFQRWKVSYLSWQTKAILCSSKPNFHYIQWFFIFCQLHNLEVKNWIHFRLVKAINLIKVLSSAKWTMAILWQMVAQATRFRLMPISWSPIVQSLDFILGETPLPDPGLSKPFAMSCNVREPRTIYSQTWLVWLERLPLISNQILPETLLCTRRNKFPALLQCWPEMSIFLENCKLELFFLILVFIYCHFQSIVYVCTVYSVWCERSYNKIYLGIHFRNYVSHISWFF